jgi:glycoprotein endo-alpha-1,2-mannosidase
VSDVRTTSLSLPSPLRWAEALFVALCGYIAFIGDGNSTFVSLHVYTLTTLLFLAAVLWLGRLVVRGDPGDEPETREFSLIGMSAARMMCFVLVGFSFHAKAQVNLLVALAAADLGLLALLARGRMRPRTHAVVETVLVLAAGIAFRSYRILDTTPEFQSDMLLLVEKALASFLNGGPAYTHHVIDQIPGKRYDLPLTYPPLLWLSYLPAFLAGVDLRWTHVAAETLTALLLTALWLGKDEAAFRPDARGATGIPRPFRRTMRDRLDVPLLLMAIHLNGYFMHRIDAEIYLIGLIFTALFLSIRRGHVALPHVLAGLALSTSQLGLLVVPFVWVHLLKKQGIRTVVRGTAITGLVAVLFWMPFLLREPLGVQAGLVEHWGTLARYPFDWAKKWIRNISLGMFAYQYGWQANLKYLQAVLGLGVFAVFCATRAFRRLALCATVAGATLVFFLAGNIISWTYLYHPALLLLLTGLLLAGRAEPERLRRMRPFVFRGTLLLLLALAALGRYAWPRAPVPTGALTVGAYYYQWFPGNFAQGYLRRQLAPQQQPVLGEYNSAEVGVIEQHIRWCREYGIDFLALNWWPGRTAQNQPIFDSFLRAANLADVRFCIHYETWNLGFDNDLGSTHLDPAKTARWLADFARIATLFDHPSYLRVHGRPVVILYLTRTLTGDYAEALQSVRACLRELGHEVYLVGDEIFWTVTPAKGKPHPLTARPQRSRIRLFDAITGYNMYEAGIRAHRGYGSRSRFVQDVAAKYAEYRAVAGPDVAIVPGILPGYNDRGVRPRRNHFAIPRQWSRFAPEGSFLERMWQGVALPFADPDVGLVMITSWNEWNEDTAIEPLMGAPATARDQSESATFYTEGYAYGGHDMTYLERIRALKTAARNR